MPLENHLETLAAICDTFSPGLDEMDAAATQKICEVFLPKHRATDEASMKSIQDFLHRSASDQGVPERMISKLKRLPADKLSEIEMLLGALGSTAGNLVLCGHAKPFARLNRKEREVAMLGFAESMLPQLRGGFMALKGLSHNIFYAMVDEAGRNPNWDAIGFDGAANKEGSPPPYQHGYSMEEINQDTKMSVDVVIIGSGCGGGVMAAELSAAGLSVLVLEKGEFVLGKDMNQIEEESFGGMYERGGLLATEDGSISIFAGIARGCAVRE
jgi:hypothetical protein